MVACRLVRSLNAAVGLQTYSMAIFAESVEDQLTSDFKTQVIYYHNKAVRNNGKVTRLAIN